MSQQLLGMQIEGIWHSGIVIYDKEFYFGKGICCEAPGSTHFGKYKFGKFQKAYVQVSDDIIPLLCILVA